MSNNQKYKISVIGGDMRSVMLSKLLEENGHEVHSFALEASSGLSVGNSIQRCYNLHEAFSISNILIFPIPFCSGDGMYLNAPFHSEKISFSMIEKALQETNFQGIIIGGKLPVQLKRSYATLRASCFDLLDRDDLAILNSIPTAEGALQIAMEELPYTIHGSNVLVCAMGRVGTTLSKLFKNVGANVTVAARKSKDFALCEAENLHFVNYDELPDILPDMRLICNTVPALIFNSYLLDYISPDALLIDLASMPGGVDFEYANSKNLRVIHALSLPGKVAPADAAKIIQKVILNILNEEYYTKGS